MLDLILELIPLVGLLQMIPYKLFKCNGHKMGVRLFDEAETAENRRMHRASRRRLQRRNARIELLKNYLQKKFVR